MTEKAGPTLRAQWLGQQLQELRKATGLKLKDAGDYLQRDTSTVGRFESGEYPIRRPDLLALLDFYGLADKRKREGLLLLHQDAWQKGWWDGYADDVDEKFVDFVWLESRATEILAFDNTMLTGLLQTEDYARAAMVAANPDADEEQVRRWLQLRMTRQEVLDEPELTVRVVLDEGVLYREVGGPAVLREQLEHLILLAKRPRIDLRVLPFEAGAHRSPAGAFRLLRMSDPYPEVGYVETLAGALYIEPPKTAGFVAAYDGLLAKSLGPRKSIEAIEALLKE
ncbi:MAG TPA: helix-turn-helix transcriptional regulator [Pseudonocardiaceae bacterium]|jgi:transcriptional regulator with XRE-family HTH domain|nr:helix-turn-helix transcriptional regulator [Pseudonocardiaceae bacterium]